MEQRIPEEEDDVFQKKLQQELCVSQDRIDFGANPGFEMLENSSGSSPTVWKLVSQQYGGRKGGGGIGTKRNEIPRQKSPSSGRQDLGLCSGVLNKYALSASYDKLSSPQFHIAYN